MENVSNILNDISKSFKNLDDGFKKSVCGQCGWSEATYYRKRNGLGKLSIAEKKTIKTVADEMIKILSKNILIK